MQLKSSLGFKPFLLSVAAFMPSASSFAYSDIDNYSNVYNVSNSGMSKYLSDLEYQVSNPIKDELLFNQLVSQWENETIFLSSLPAIIENPNFKAIVSMGERATPFILDYISHKPSTLVWALNLIYNTKISDNPKLTIPEACKLWVKAFQHKS